MSAAPATGAPPATGAAPGVSDLFPAAAPAEARGLERDGVRMLVAHRDGRSSVHTRLRDLPGFLRHDDLLVVNTSGVLPASLPAYTAGGSALRLHLSTHLDGGRWLVEVRLPHGDASRPLLDASAGQRLALPPGGEARLLEPFAAHTRRSVDWPRPGSGRPTDHPMGAGTRLWVAEVDTPGTVHGFLLRHGRPIRYGGPVQPWPLSAYQTMFAAEPGSAESPSAGRGFTPDLLARLRRRGVQVARVVLHTGVSSQEAGEPPYPERYRVPPAAAEAIAAARRAGGRVVAVGTTVTRALETVARTDGTVRPGGGWTDLVVTPERGVRVVDGLLSGWHEPAASHLRLIEAVAGSATTESVYADAVAAGYRGHEFGDLLLVLP